jgi:hypothetical protein
MCGFCNVWMSVCVGFVMCGCFDCVGVLVICVLASTVFLYWCVYVYLLFFFIIDRNTVTK